MRSPAPDASHLPRGASTESSPVDQAARQRRVSLSRLVALWPAEIEDLSIASRERLIAKLERALRSERRRGRAGHWTYDLARHTQLVRAYRAEQEALKAAKRAARSQGQVAIHP